MAKTKIKSLMGKLDRLRTELVELAFTLDSRGRFDAADVAMTASARVGELIRRPKSNTQRRTSNGGR
jgi:hypothetical protein